MTDPVVACPECAGLSQPSHPAGLLGGWHHAGACTLLAHEDGQAVGDRDRPWGLYGFTRPATATEATLLAALGYVPPAGLVTRVWAGAVRRTWPALESSP